jgi:hypothetical protein
MIRQTEVRNSRRPAIIPRMILAFIIATQIQCHWKWQWKWKTRTIFFQFCIHWVVSTDMDEQEFWPNTKTELLPSIQPLGHHTPSELVLQGRVEGQLHMRAYGQSCASFFTGTLFIIRSRKNSNNFKKKKKKKKKMSRARLLTDPLPHWEDH